ncbi:MAG: hypothetical protein WA750_13810, partial [Pseudolabrys sp.]
VFHNLIGRGELEAICLVSMQARQVQIIVARDLRHRLATRDTAVDFGAFKMLARGANSAHTSRGNVVTLMMS